MKKYFLLFIIVTILYGYYYIESRQVFDDVAEVSRPTAAPPLKALSDFSMRGIDVSAYNGNIDWSKVKADNVQFAFIKATESVNIKDKKENENILAAKNAGLKVSTYHFYSLCVDGKKQAYWYINNIKKSSLDFPPAVDLELYRNCRGKSKDYEMEQFKIFTTILQKNFIKKPIIYTTIDTMHEFSQLFPFGDFPLWVRVVDRHVNDLTGPNIFGIDDETFLRQYISENYTIWQATSTATVSGIKGFVDLNYWK